MFVLVPIVSAMNIITILDNTCLCKICLKNNLKTFYHPLNTHLLKISFSFFVLFRMQYNNII